MKEDYHIESTERLRELIGSPNQRLSNKIGRRVDSIQRDFIRKSPLVFVSTSDSKNNQEVSPKGDSPGFVKVKDDRTLLIPERPGNRLAFGFENILQNGKVGIIFLVPGVIETLRVSGSASLSNDPNLLDELSAQGKPALLCTILKVDKCWFHCGKAMKRSNLWKPDTWIENAQSNYVEQVANTLGIETDRVRSTVEADYEHNLY